MFDYSKSSKIHEAACIHRAQGEFKEAIALVEENLPEIHADCRLPLLLEGFYSAEKIGRERAEVFARLVAEEEPEIPSIQKYL